jgi:hypothetical protein
MRAWSENRNRSTGTLHSVLAIVGIVVLFLLIVGGILHRLSPDRLQDDVDLDATEAGREYAARKERQEASSRFWGGFLP